MSERAAGSVSHRNPFPRDMIHCYMPSMDHPVYHALKCSSKNLRSIQRGAPTLFCLGARWCTVRGGLTHCARQLIFFDSELPAIDSIPRAYLSTVSLLFRSIRFRLELSVFSKSIVPLLPQLLNSTDIYIERVWRKIGCIDLFIRLFFCLDRCEYRDWQATIVFNFNTFFLKIKILYLDNNFTL